MLPSTPRFDTGPFAGWSGTVSTGSAALAGGSTNSDDDESTSDVGFFSKTISSVISEEDEVIGQVTQLGGRVTCKFCKNQHIPMNRSFIFPILLSV